MLAEMIVFAAATLAGFVAGRLLSTYGSGGKAGASSLTAMDGAIKRLAALDRRVDEIAASVEKTANARLAVEVDALGGAIEALKVSNRREFGKLWGRLNGLNGETSPSDDAPDRDTLRAQYLKPPMGAAP